MENINTHYKSVLTIAGSDSGGCAGIQADIKSISACGAFAASVITATTAQNTQGVFDIHPIPTEHIEKQLDAVLSDIEFDAIKIGMLHSCDVINVVKRKLKEYTSKNIILDPVMVATSGDTLITKDAINCLQKFLPEVLLITPNIPEAELLLGEKIESNSMEDAATSIGQKYTTSVLLKGGHLNNTQDVVDILYIQDTKKVVPFVNTFVDTKNTHGTGCSLSSSIASFIALEYNLEKAVEKACSYVNSAIKSGKHKLLGKGNGPIDHFFYQ